ncbi:unnamed protein product [Closterium sp. Yama58-4]|nr:unnamed protein product [Closterium sp. Yama58-4]
MHVMRLLQFLLFVTSRLRTHLCLLFVTYQVEMCERGAAGEEGGAAGERREADAEQGREKEQQEQREEQEEGAENESDIDGFNGSKEESYRYNHGDADEADVEDHGDGDGDDDDEEEEDGDADEVLTVDDAIDSIGFGPYQLFLVCYTGLAWLADAMEMILLSFVGPAARCEFGLSGAEESLIASVVFLGVFLGSYVWGLVADAYGRRRGFMATDLFNSVTSIQPPLVYVLPFHPSVVHLSISGARTCGDSWQMPMGEEEGSWPLLSSLSSLACSVHGRPPSSRSSSLAASWDSALEGHQWSSPSALSSSPPTPGDSGSCLSSSSGL